MDLLERARALAVSPLFSGLAPAVLTRLAERARPHVIAGDETRTSSDTVWVVAAGSFDVEGTIATGGSVIGMIRVLRDATPTVELRAREAGVLVGLAVDDVRDILEEDSGALSALADRLAGLLADADE